MEGYTMKLFMKNMIAAVALFAVVGVNTVDCAKSASTAVATGGSEDPNKNNNNNNNNNINNNSNNNVQPNKRKKRIHFIKRKRNDDETQPENQPELKKCRLFTLIKGKGLNTDNFIKLLKDPKNQQTFKFSDKKQFTKKSFIKPEDQDGVKNLINCILQERENAKKKKFEEYLKNNQLAKPNQNLGVATEDKKDETIDNPTIVIGMFEVPLSNGTSSATGVTFEELFDAAGNNDSDDDVSDSEEINPTNNANATFVKPNDVKPDIVKPVKKVKTTSYEKNVATVVAFVLVGATLGSLAYPLSGNNPRAWVFVVDGAVLGLAAGLVYVFCVAQK